MHWTSKIKGAQHVISLKKKTETSLSRPRAKVKYQGPLGCASYLKQSPVYDTDGFNFDWVIQKWAIFTIEQNPVLGKTENLKSYCAFHKRANSQVQKPPSQILRFSLPSIIIMITSNEPWNTETHKTDRNPPITNHKPWPFEPVKVKFCFLKGPLRWLTAAENAIVSWLLNFRIHMFVKSAVNQNQTKIKWDVHLFTPL